VPSQVSRPLSLAAFAVHEGSLVAVDDGIPVVVEIDLESGRTTRIYEWPISNDHRDRPIALGVTLGGQSILVASPAAGGLVSIDRTTGEATVIHLEEDVGSIVTSESEVWAIAAPDWEENSGSDREESREAVRSVKWEEATHPPPEVRTGWVAYAPLNEEADLEPDMSLEEWRELEGDTEPLGPPTPIWRIYEATAQRLSFEGQAPTVTAIGDRLVGVCQLPSDPIVKTLEGGGVSWGYPGSVFVLEGTESLRVAGSVGFTAGSAWSDAGRVWLLGFGPSLDGEQPEVREVDPDSAELGEPLTIEVRDPAAVCNGRVADILWGRPPLVRLIPIDGDGDAIEIDVPELIRWQEVKTDEDSIFFANRDQGLVIQISTAQNSVRVIRLETDLSDYMPHPVPPEGVDLRTHEEAELVKIRDSLLQGWVDNEGRSSPFIEGVRFESVELQDSFPRTAVIGLFQSDHHAGVLFGRRWALYDELGNPCELTYRDIHLMEDIESGAGGLPPLEDCIADEAGVVWF
jgi:hypothetical protein